MNKFGFFYYSENREKMLRDSYTRPPRNYFKTLTGKVKRYNEWASKFPFLPMGVWRDQKFVGIGWYDHSERP